MSEQELFKNTKDNFSNQAAAYSQFRPGYPESLYEFILSHTVAKICALDVATGNGQVAGRLSESFEQVFAIDISEKQMLHAVRKSNIHYSVARAESSGMEDHMFDLITVGQAAHWFHLHSFYKEVQRIIKPGGTLALFGYQLPVFNDATDDAIMEFYETILGRYWDPERLLVDHAYETLHFPFQKIRSPKFTMEYTWNIDQLLGFLNTWSAVQHYIKKEGTHPLPIIESKLRDVWGIAVEKKISFPVFLLLTKFL